MNITKIAINNKPLFAALVVAAVLMGITDYNSMSRDDMPPFLIRAASVVTTFPGASPARVEELVTDKIEKIIQEIPEVDYINSESRTGLSIVTIMIKDSESDLRPIFDNIRRKVEEVEPNLPSDTSVRVDDEMGDVFGILLGLVGEGYSPSELKDIADEIRDGLIKIPDAAKVEIAGEQEERVFIEYDDAKLALLGLSKKSVEQVITQTNILFPGGDIRLEDERVLLEPTGSFASLEALGKTIISPDNSDDIIQLGDVTTIYRAHVDPARTLVRINGEQGLVLGVSLKEGGNIITLGHQVEQKINEYLETYPIGIDLFRVASQDQVVEKSVDDFLNNLIQSVVIVLATMFIFLGFRTGIVVSALIPATIVVTFLVMSKLGLGLNKVSLASLIIALGMLVDNAIVMSEAIMVKMESGLKAVEATIAAAMELMVPLLTSSLTTIAAFLAFYLAESTMGEIMGQIFVVVAIALISSWVLSLTIIPLLAIRFIRIDPAKKQKRGVFDRLTESYSTLLRAGLRRPKSVCLIIAILFLGSLAAFTRIPFVFFPQSERPLVSANLELPLGTDIRRTDAVVKEIEAFIKKNLLAKDNEEGGITSWSTYIGEGAPKYDLGYTPPESSPNAAHILMNTTDDAANQRVIDMLNRFCFDSFPDLTATIDRLAEGGGSATPVAIRIAGKDAKTLSHIMEQVKVRLTKIPGTRNVTDDWGVWGKKLVVTMDNTRTRLAGLTNQEVATALQTALSGSTVDNFREGDKEIPIVMRSRLGETMTINRLETLPIFSQAKQVSVPLKQVADIGVTWQATKVLRRDLYKTMTVSCNLGKNVTAKEITDQIKPWLEKQQQGWGPGYTYELGGDAENSSKSMGAVAENLPLSGFIIVLLLIAQFNSFKKPSIVLMTIPLGLIGVSAGLILCGSTFGFMAFLGLISLSGIVINNAIVLLDRIKIETDLMEDRPGAAIINAGVQRFRPILLTTATTTFGLVPLWIGGGILWRPMAITIIFGLLFATVITLIFVPVLYRLFYRVQPE